MSNFSKTTNFAIKDSLLTGDPAKVIKGTEHNTEYDNIATAIATKTDNSAAAITGGSINGTLIGNSTPAAGTFTQLNISTAVGKIIPGATSISLRNNADSADNLSVLENGNTTVRGTFTATGGITNTFANVFFSSQFFATF